MNIKSHQGVVKKTVTIDFENGYSLAIEKGVEIGLFVAIEDRVVLPVATDGQESSLIDEVCTCTNLDGNYISEHRTTCPLYGHSQDIYPSGGVTTGRR